MCRLNVQQAPAIYLCGLWRRWVIKGRMHISALHFFRLWLHYSHLLMLFTYDYDSLNCDL